MYVPITKYPWGGSFCPEAFAEAKLTGSSLKFRLWCCEKHPRVTMTTPNSMVCLDSCLEVFLNPYPDFTRDYLNFEMNSLGTLLLGIGTQTDGRVLLDFDVRRFRIQPKIQNGIWTHRLYVPFDFLQEQFGKIEPVFRGNLFKCGDETVHPHFGSWNPIVWPEPQFHLSQFFGTFVLQP